MKRSPPFSLLRLSRSSTSSSSPPPPLDPSPLVSSIVDDLSGLTLLELSDLTETLRARFRVDQTPYVAVMTPGMSVAGLPGTKSAGGGGAAEEKVEKTAFDLKLESFDPASKIKIIKEVRSFTDLGLKEAKDLVEKAPSVLKRGLIKEEADRIVEKMKLAGAKVVLE